MSSKIQHIKIKTQPERVRGTSDLLVNIEVNYEDGCSRSFVYVTNSLNTDEINQGIINSVCNQGLGIVPTDLFIASCKVAGKTALKGMTEEERKEMSIPCSEKQQDVIDGLCKDLMINTIDVSSMDIASFHCMVLCLRERLNH